MSSTFDKNDIANKIDKASSLDKLEELRIHYLGKKGLLTSEMKSLSLLSIEEKKEQGQKLNILKSFLESELLKKKNIIENIAIDEKIKRGISSQMLIILFFQDSERANLQVCLS